LKSLVILVFLLLHVAHIYFRFKACLVDRCGSIFDTDICDYIYSLTFSWNISDVYVSASISYMLSMSVSMLHTIQSKDW